MPKKIKQSVGRPTKYDPSFCESLIDFFNIPPYTIKDMTIQKPDGTQIDKTEFEANDIPFFSKWCRKIGVNQETMVEWTKRYPDFSVAYNQAKELQCEILVTNGLRGTYATPFAIFTAKNILGWRDKSDVEHSGKVEGTRINIMTIDKLSVEKTDDRRQLQDNRSTN